jgi:hypothetical protein
MAITAGDCLAFAAEMERMAAHSSDEEARRRMCEIAATWRALARQMDPALAAESE